MPASSVHYSSDQATFPYTTHIDDLLPLHICTTLAPGPSMARIAHPGGTLLPCSQLPATSRLTPDHRHRLKKRHGLAQRYGDGNIEHSPAVISGSSGKNYYRLYYLVERAILSRHAFSSCKLGPLHTTLLSQDRSLIFRGKIASDWRA
jgi:hypothetical protein